MALTVELDIRNPSGLHARPAAVFVKAAAGFGSDIRVANLSTESPEVTAKSIIAVLGLGVQRGHRIRLRAEGADEADAMAALEGLVAAGLEEPLDEAPPAAPVA
ncbi:MAG: HPr family phosphocarrier protein [Chloroflexi bacterium]|nr:HPr family phosphocarrier protein [Chloroflexota bacterium]